VNGVAPPPPPPPPVIDDMRINNSTNVYKDSLGRYYVNKGQQVSLQALVSLSNSSSFTGIVTPAWSVTPSNSGVTVTPRNSGNVSGLLTVSNTLSSNREFVVTASYGSFSDSITVRARARMPINNMQILRDGVVTTSIDHPSFDDGSSDVATYSARLVYSDGYSHSVNPDWDTGSTVSADINNNGRLSTKDVMSDTLNNITIEYDFNNIYYPDINLSFDYSLPFTILNQQDFTSEIKWPTRLWDNNAEGYQYTVEAIMTSDGSRVLMTPSWQVTDLLGQPTSVATIDSAGILRTNEVGQDTEVIVSADFTYLGDRVKHSETVMVEKKSPLDIAIAGPSVVAEQNSTDYQYTVNATMRDGSSIQVNPEWSVTDLSGQPTNHVKIDELGNLTSHAVSQDEQVIIHASFSYLGETADSQRAVVVSNSSIVNSLSINGPVSLGSDSSANYTVTATYDDGSSSTINSSDVIWSASGSEAISIDPSGVMTVGSVNQNQITTIHALYRNGGVTETAEVVVSIVASEAEASTIIERVNVASDGTQANNRSFYSPSISANGRYTAFISEASNLVVGDTNGYFDFFVYDRISGSTERVNVASGGAQSNGQSYYAPSISADGRYVVFQSEASNLVPGDTNGDCDVFVHDRVSGSTERVNMSSDGTQANHHCVSPPSISADGRYVAFVSHASTLVRNDTNAHYDVFVHDRFTDSTERVSVASDGTQATGSSFYAPMISADGRYVAFTSEASNLVAGDTNGFDDVFVHDRVSNSTERVNVASDATQTNNQTYLRPSISADGRYVAFYSNASNLVADDTNGVSDIFVHDRVSDSTERVSVSSDAMQANQASYPPSISADGRYVVFSSEASNLVANDSNGVSEIFVHDRVSRTTGRVNMASDGTQANQLSFNPSISSDGRNIAFISRADNLLGMGMDTNSYDDVFVASVSSLGTISVQLTVTSDAVSFGEELTVDLHMESNDRPSTGGGLNINYDTALLDFVSFTPNPALVLDSAFGREPDITTEGVTLNGLAFGEFEGLSGSQLIGTLTFNPLSTGTVDLALSDNSTPMGTFYMVDGSVPATINYTGTSITITDNAVPVASNLSIITDAGIAKSGNMLAIDSDVEDQLIYQIADMPGKGDVVIDNPTTGAFTYTPYIDQIGADSFTYQASDGKQVSLPATVSITINENINVAPVASGSNISTDEDVVFTNGTLVASDADSPVLTYRIDTNGLLGTAVVIDANTGAFHYTPTANVNGSDSFTFIATDELLQDSNIATINVTINPVNDAPVAGVNDFATLEDQSFSGTLAMTDADGDALTYSVVSHGALGSVVINNTATGAFTYTPTLNANGDGSFTFRVTDGSTPITATATVTLAAVNDVPIAVSDTISVVEGSLVTANIIANDQDIDQDTLFIIGIDTASSNGGAIVNNGDGTVTYTPPTDFYGSDSFVYQLSDGMATATGAVAVTISPVNDTVIRVNAGGNAVIDSLGRSWDADYGFNNTGVISGIANPIVGKEAANDSYIYQTERSTNWDGSTISYSYGVPNGDYHVVLHFADTYFWLNGQRVFNVLVEGQPLLTNLDLISEVSYNAPLIERFDVSVSDGTINIDFSPVSEIPVINGIEIIAKGISRSVIPGKLQAEDYNAGANGIAYVDMWGGNDGGIYRRDDVDIAVTSDFGGGYKIGWTQGNEWLNYDVFVAETGLYDIDIRTSNTAVDWYWGRVNLELDGAALTNLLIAPLTAGSEVFDEISVQKVLLAAGPHTLKLKINQGGIDVNWLNFTKHTSLAIPGRVEAEDYGNGGAGLSYFDSSIGNYVGWYRHDDVDVDITSDIGGGYKVAWIENSEWLEYEVVITTSGMYDLEFRVSKGDVGNAVFHLEHDGVDITGPIIVSGSGTYDWNAFNTITKNNIHLTEGSASLKIVIDQASMDINWMQFILTSPN